MKVGDNVIVSLTAMLTPQAYCVGCRGRVKRVLFGGRSAYVEWTDGEPDMFGGAVIQAVDLIPDHGDVEGLTK